MTEMEFPEIDTKTHFLSLIKKSPKCSPLHIIIVVHIIIVIVIGVSMSAENCVYIVMMLKIAYVVAIANNA